MRIQLAKEVAQLSEHREKGSHPSRAEVIHQVALELLQSVLSTKDPMSWPPKQAKLTADDVQIPDDMRAFLFTLLTGNEAPPEICSQRV